VTEFGAVRLKFLNLEFRALALIQIAHPEFRDDLTRQAIANGLNLSGVSRLRPPPEKFFCRPDGAIRPRSETLPESAVPLPPHKRDHPS